MKVRIIEARIMIISIYRGFIRIFLFEFFFFLKTVFINYSSCGGVVFTKHNFSTRIFFFLQNDSSDSFDFYFILFTHLHLTNLLNSFRRR